MTLAVYLACMLGAGALVLSPGPDFIFSLSRGLVHGWRGGVTAASGIALGLMTHTLVALLGVSALLAASPSAFGVLKVLGAVYLVYLSLRMLTGRDLQFPAGMESSLGTPVALPYLKILRQGYTVNVLNPGAALTLAAYFPPFIPQDSEHKQALFLLLAGSLVAMAFVWFSLAGTFAGAFTGFLRAHPRVLRGVRLLFGSILLALAVLLLARG